MSIEKAMPQWAADLKKNLETMADSVEQQLTGWKDNGAAAEPEQFGYQGTGKATAAIQSAIDAVAAQGGGVVRLANGDYISGTIDFHSNVCLEIGKGARLLGSTDLADYPDRIAKRRRLSARWSFLRRTDYDCTD